jgi:hypothetical protein
MRALGKKAQDKMNKNLDPAGIEPATLSVLTTCDNPYTTEPMSTAEII